MVKLFPNPAHEVVNISSTNAELKEVVVYNTMGSVVMEIVPTGAHQIEMDVSVKSKRRQTLLRKSLSSDVTIQSPYPPMLKTSRLTVCLSK